MKPTIAICIAVVVLAPTIGFMSEYPLSGLISALLACVVAAAHEFREPPR